MARIKNLKVSAKGRIRLPAALLARWGLQSGGEIGCLDVGDAVLLFSGDVEALDGGPSDPVTEARRSAVAARDSSWPPPSDERISFGVQGEAWEVSWGRHDKFGTAAYWIDQTISGGYADDDAFETMDLKSATVWGLLHGHGVVAEVANAYLDEVMGLLKKDETPSATAVAEVLATPIKGIGLYRYPNRKAAFISEAAARLVSDPPPDDVDALRRYLMRLRGVGPKTAALIEMGLRGPHAEVHVNDIHLRRALLRSGVFRAYWDVDQHYDRFETAFLQYARHGNVAPGALDWCIWDLARAAGSSAFGESG
jgi:hypothetical protein